MSNDWAPVPLLCTLTRHFKSLTGKCNYGVAQEVRGPTSHTTTPGLEAWLKLLTPASCRYTISQLAAPVTELLSLPWGDLGGAPCSWSRGMNLWMRFSLPPLTPVRDLQGAPCSWPCPHWGLLWASQSEPMTDVISLLLTF